MAERKHSASATAELEQRPVFINNQPTVVIVYDENRRPIQVDPFFMRTRPNANFAVEGEHFRQFLHPNGPLTFLDPTLHGEEAYEKVEDFLDARQEDRERADRMRKRWDQQTKAEQVIHAPARLGRPVPVVLPVAVKDAFDAEFQDALPQEREDLAFILGAELEDEHAELPPYLSKYGERLARVIREAKAEDGPDDDPMNPKSERFGEPIAGQTTHSQRRALRRGQVMPVKGGENIPPFPLNRGESPRQALANTPAATSDDPNSVRTDREQGAGAPEGGREEGGQRVGERGTGEGQTGRRHADEEQRKADEKAAEKGKHGHGHKK